MIKTLASSTMASVTHRRVERNGFGGAGLAGLVGLGALGGLGGGLDISGADQRRTTRQKPNRRVL